MKLASALQSLPFNISPEQNTMLSDCEGINIPFWYLAGRGSFSSIHQEDGFLDSSNIVHWDDAESKYHNVWLFIHPHATKRCIKTLRFNVRKMWSKKDHSVRLVR